MVEGFVAGQIDRLARFIACVAGMEVDMMHVRWTVVLILTVMTMTVAGFSILAAPMLPEGTRLPAELESMADLEQLTLELRPLPTPVLQAGIRADHLKAQIEARLDDAGLEVVEAGNETLIGLRVVVETGTDPELPEFVSLAVFIDFIQPVRVERLGRQLVLPTATVTYHEPKRADKLGQGVHDFVDFAVRRFISMQQLTKDR